MLNIRILSRLVFAATATFAGVNALSSVPSGASPSSSGGLHSGKVIFPTVTQANLERTQGAPGPMNDTSNFVLSSHGGLNGVEVTTGAPKVYLVFYGSQWGTASTDPVTGDLTFSGDPAGMAPRLQELFKGLGTNNERWSDVMRQYCNNEPIGATKCSAGGVPVGYPTGGALAGVWYDNSMASPLQATGYQLAAEAVAAAGHFGNDSARQNRSAQYVIISPTGMNPDNYKNQGFCAWHDYSGDTTLDGGGAAPSPYGPVAFTNLPYIPDAGTGCGANFVNSGTSGLLDGVTIVEGHEYAETLTDQFPSYGYMDNASQSEDGDVCAWLTPGSPGGAANVSFATGSFAMQSTWSNADDACEISGANGVFGYQRGPLP